MNNRGRTPCFIDLFLIFVICFATASCSDSKDSAQLAKDLEAQAEAFSREHKEWQPPGWPRIRQR